MIEFRQISKSYGRQCVICDQNLTIRDGEFFVLVGPSGSGKTTLLKMINRLIPQTEGEIYIDGKKIEEYPLRALRLSIGYVLQQIALFPNLTVYENIALIPEIKKWKKAERLAKTASLLEKAGLDPQQYLHRYPKELSGGEQQRVSIARAVAKNPKILLCDEPTGALDYNTGKQVLQILQDMSRNQGATVIIVTHNAALAPIADRVIRMHDARVKSVTVNEEPQDISTLEY